MNDCAWRMGDALTRSPTPRYSANRWERVDLLNKTLADGVTVVLDRYAYSGVAFSSAKDGMDLEWCMQPDAGLPAPDLLVHLELGAKEVLCRIRGCLH